MDWDAVCFAKVWPRQLQVLRSELRSARATADRGLVAGALAVYECYYQARAEAVASDPVRAFAAPWATALEHASHWIAGWRPNALVHVLYSEAGQRFEAQLADLLRFGVHSGDLGDLTGDQLVRVDDIQRQTIKQELAIEREMEEVQGALADLFLGKDMDMEASWLAGLARVMRRADELRLRTLREVLAILEPLQAVDLVVAAADLGIGIRELGLEHERGEGELTRPS